MNRFKSLVVGIDVSSREHLVAQQYLSPASRVALERAAWLARAHESPLHVVTSLDVDPLAESLIARENESGESVLGTARGFLERAVRRLRDDGITVTTEVALGDPTRVLLRDVEANGRDLVVVGTRERGRLARMLLGSTALALLRRSPVPVWVARREYEHSLRRVLVPIELGTMAPTLLEAASFLAKEMRAEVHVLHVVDVAAEEVLRAGAADERLVLEYRKERRARAEAEVPKLVEGCCDPQLTVRTHLVDGHVADLVVLHAEGLEADVVVMGSVAHHGVTDRLLGRTADKVLPLLQSSLLVMKPRPAADPGA